MTTSQTIKNVAILGGGITGLSTAYYLSRMLPTAKITLYEASNRVGGYIQSGRYELPNHEAKILFEQGPRTLRVSKRVSSVNVFSLLRELNLTNELILVQKNSAASRNRYIFYSGRINMVPYSLLSILRFYFSQPLFKGMLPELLMEPFRNENKKSRLVVERDDESIGSFMSRRFGTRITNRLISAAINGIYAGDIYKLSIKSIMEYIWNREKLFGRVITFFQKPRENIPVHPYASKHRKNLEKLMEENKELMDNLKNVSIVSFKNGMGKIVDKLLEELSKNKNITIKYNAPVTDIKNEEDGIIISTGSTSTQKFSHVISALPARHLANIVPQQIGDALRNIPTVSVNVVNLFYNKKNLLPITGFGYLIPLAVPEVDNPELALGVVFDSDAVTKDRRLDTTPGNLQDPIEGTKLTVMLGGHNWEGRKPVTDPEMAVSQAKDLVRRHLKVKDVPCLTKSTFQDSCIPQYVVGHQANLRKVHDCVLNEYNGRLLLLGASYLGVSVNDCIYYSRVAVEDLIDKNGVGVTGLESKAL
ncbi:hypothetical protein V1511DRAFT_521317 [Dipodascopsis uninucleata]